MGICVWSRSAYGAPSVNRPFSERRIRRRAASDSLPYVRDLKIPSKGRLRAGERCNMAVFNERETELGELARAAVA